jgi:hypothetical protein
MRSIISSFLIIFSGWTLATHFCVLLGWNLKDLLRLAPFLTLALFGTYVSLTKIKHARSGGNNALVWGRGPANSGSRMSITISLFVLPALLYWSWLAFWFLSVFILSACLLSDFSRNSPEYLGHDRNCSVNENIIVGLFSTAAIILAYAVSRSDLDDAFYVAVSAFSSSNPESSLLNADPMLGENDLPLLFPSYRFSSFELLSGALGYLLSVPAMDAYYIYQLPLWIIASIAANFLLTRELIPKHWLMAGVIALFLILLLGETHRSPANFSFARIFQGKAVFLSVVVPSIYYLTARFFSIRGSNSDLFLLSCCQVASIGLSNFGMLAAPMAGLGAVISNIPLALKGERRRLYAALAVLFIPLPYLIDTALQSIDSPVFNFGTESAENVWVSVFGHHQQYLIGILLLAGPVLAKDTITRWRLAVPPLLLLAIYLNPWLSDFISKHLTTPPVYWRVVWSFPILVFAAVSLCMIMTGALERISPKLFSVSLFVMTLSLTIYSLPLNTIRPENIGRIEGFATWKIPKLDLLVAQKSIDLVTDGGRLLAPDEIAGVVSRFDRHPQLVSTRGLYLDLLRPSIGVDSYEKRRVLYDFVIGSVESSDQFVREALLALDVSVIVVSLSNETPQIIRILESNKYTRREVSHGYVFWKK